MFRISMKINSCNISLALEAICRFSHQLELPTTLKQTKDALLLIEIQYSKGSTFTNTQSDRFQFPTIYTAVFYHNNWPQWKL
jgi:hypothetical protein